jgi:hypothetical protein
MKQLFVCERGDSIAMCQHLSQLERELLDAGIPEIFRGKAWSKGAREWVYFDCVLDRRSLRTRLTLADCVVDHDHLGTHDGQESGFVCSQCHDGVLGIHPEFGSGRRAFFDKVGGTARTDRHFVSP